MEGFEFSITGWISVVGIAIEVFGVLVIIHTFLSWALVLEIEWRWPWQAERRPAPNNDGDFL